MQESRRDDAAEAAHAAWNMPSSESAPKPEETQEQEPLPSAKDLVENYVLWRPTLAAELRAHGESMVPPRTNEQLMAEIAKKLDVNRSIQLKEVTRLQGKGVRKAVEGLYKGLGVAFTDMTGNDWRNSEPDLEPGDSYWGNSQEEAASDSVDTNEGEDLAEVA